MAARKRKPNATTRKGRTRKAATPGRQSTKQPVKRRAARPKRSTSAAGDMSQAAPAGDAAPRVRYMDDLAADPAIRWKDDAVAGPGGAAVPPLESQVVSALPTTSLEQRVAELERQIKVALAPRHDEATLHPLDRREKLAEHLMRTVVAVPLLIAMKKSPTAPVPVIVDFHNSYPGGKRLARARVLDLLSVTRSVTAALGPARRLQDMSPRARRDISDNYLFANLLPVEIEALVRLDNGWSKNDRSDSGATRSKAQPGGPPRAVYRIWLDHEVNPLLTNSRVTVKADAAKAAFTAEGRDIVWAVIDSGVDGEHPHFLTHGNLTHLPAGVAHKDFSSDSGGEALRDEFGHGTHVAAIIAGELSEGAHGASVPLRATTSVLNEKGTMESRPEEFSYISGVAPRCRLVSLKVLDKSGRGNVSNVIAALQEVQRVNDNGRHVKIHGVNLSVGYEYRAEWFACGQSPVCVEVDRLVKSGVVVVVAAGNTGYGTGDARARATSLGFLLSINDPGNAELAITVGATHRDMPHVYGVSYFSSKGPTGDGRLKPDVLAPGEKILSARSKQRPARPGEPPQPDLYVEDSGTSMAAPHVSGAAAAFLSIRREFIGRPERVKEIFMASATDLHRERYLQGSGLIDLMRAIQSV
jgi:serine protease AprX